MAKRGRPPKDPQLAKRFQKNLKKYAKAKHLTQKAIALALDESQQRVSNWFLGVSMPPEEVLNQLLEVLGVTREQMFK